MVDNFHPRIYQSGVRICQHKCPDCHRRPCVDHMDVFCTGEDLHEEIRELYDQVKQIDILVNRLMQEIMNQRERITTNNNDKKEVNKVTPRPKALEISCRTDSANWRRNP